jgi:zinc transport system substrate-binding protein
VVVSIVPQAWLVEEIGGSHVEVMTLVEPDESPATYQPTDAQVSQALKADAYFRIGVPFERTGWLRALQSADSLRVIDTRTGVTLRDIEAHSHDDHGHDHAHEHSHEHAEPDPHIWLAPALLKVQARTVAETLAEIDPERRAMYETNLAKLIERLDATDATIRTQLEPHEGKAFFVFHPAWGYFADAYGLRQIAIEIGGKSPSDVELTRLQQLARNENVRVIFVQPQISGSGAQAVAAATGATVEVLDPLSANVIENLMHITDRLARSFER